MQKDWVSYKGDQLKRPEDIEGFNILTDEQKTLFQSFLSNFYNRWEFPERHIPISVRFENSKKDGNYLRVEFESGDWLHVKSSSIWY